VAKCTYPTEDLVNNSDLSMLCWNITSNLRQNGNDRILSQEGGLPAHIRPSSERHHYAVHPVITHNRLPPSSVPPPTKQSLPTNICPRSQSPVSTMGCRPPMTRCAVPTLRTGLVHFCSFASVAKAVATSSSSKTRALRRSNRRLCITSRRSLVKHRDSSTRIWSLV
jgi:hypothetical protein